MEHYCHFGLLFNEWKTQNDPEYKNKKQLVIQQEKRAMIRKI